MPSITVVNKKKGGRGIYIGRGNPRQHQSALGNPFKMKSEADRDTVVDKYQEWLNTEMVKKEGEVYKEVMRIAALARAKESVCLVCWCAPKRCHGDVVKTVVEDVVGRQLKEEQEQEQENSDAKSDEGE